MVFIEAYNMHYRKDQPLQMFLIFEIKRWTFVKITFYIYKIRQNWQNTIAVPRITAWFCARNRSIIVVRLEANFLRFFCLRVKRGVCKQRKTWKTWSLFLTYGTNTLLPEQTQIQWRRICNERALLWLLGKIPIELYPLEMRTDGIEAYWNVFLHILYLDPYRG